MLPWFAGIPGAELAVLALAFAWGATLGSFVNVVVHRVPRRQSVVVGASRCPTCGTPIEPRDNVPVVGWILLGGRCRACGTAISPRYPLVEAACGAIATAIAAVEVVGGGGSLPWLGNATWQGVDRLLMHGDFRLAVSWALHTGVLVLLVAWSLLAGRPDPHRVSRRTAWIAVALAVVVVATLPDVGPPGIGGGGDRWPHSPRLAAIVAAATGVAAGWALGCLTARANDASSLAVFGAVVGWQTVTVVAIATAALRRGVAAGRRHGRPTLDPLPAVATAAVVFWRPLRAAIGMAWESFGGG
jgi:prepilin signal peptidase PulO-like enzyme (type II secretory pathway)